MAPTATKKKKQQSKPRPPARVNPMRRSTDIEDVRFPTRAVVSLVLFTAALVGGQWASISSVRGDIAAIITRMDAKDIINKNAEEAAQKVADAEKTVMDRRLQDIEKKIDDVERNYKLGDYDIKAMITTVRPK